MLVGPSKNTVMLECHYLHSLALTSNVITLPPAPPPLTWRHILSKKKIPCRNLELEKERKNTYIGNPIDHTT
jgi:hypothetical protein